MGGLGRMTPLQGDMLSLSGLVFGRSGDVEASDEIRLRTLREALRQPRMHTKTDHRFNLSPWRALPQKDERFRSEYHHPYAWSTTCRRVEKLLEDPERLRLVALLEAPENAWP